MTEIRGACPAHSADTGGSDSYSFNSDKGVGHCLSCGLNTWTTEEGDLWGRYGRHGKPFPISEGAVVEEDDWASEPQENDRMTEEKNEGAYVPLRGITKDTMEFFGVKTSGNKQMYVYPSGGVKTRYLDNKSFSAANGFRGDELFGMNLFPAGCSKKLTVTEGECFPDVAEVFTPKGWKPLSQIYAEDLVMQVNPDGTGSWTVPNVIVDKHYEGNLVEYKSGSYYSLTTPDHNLVRNHPKEGLKKFPAKENSTFSIPRTVDMQGWCGYTLDQLRIWVMLSADFTFRKSGDIYGAFKKKRKVDRAKLLLNNLGVRFSANEVKNGYTSIYIHRNHELSFAKKDLPWSMVWSGHKKEILEEIIFWDGNYVKGKNQAEFSTNRKHNADVVQALAHSCGYVSTIINRSNDYGNWMKVSILFGKSNSSTQKGYTNTHYNGRVMCVQVDSGMILVRQNGSVSISGNCDAMSAWQMLKGSYLNPVVGLPGASPSGKLWEKCKKYLDSFEEIILSVDNDDPGDKVAQLISEIFPGKVTRMEHGQYKDANDFLQAGDAQAYKQAWWKAKKVKPDNILIGGDDFLSLYEDSPDFEYFETGIKELDEKMLGICKGYVTLIQAESGLGKTEFTRYLEWQCLTNSTYKIAAMHLEETKLRSILGLVSYKLGDNLTIKKFIEEKGREEDVKHAIKELTDSERFMLFDYDMQEGHEELVRQVRYLVAALKVDFIVIEPIQDCVTGSSSEKEGKLADLITQLSTLAAKTNVGIVVVAHQNSEGGAMYSSMITKRAAFEILLKRDRESEDLVEQNRTHVIIGRKNRTGLGSGKAGAVDFDLESYTLKPVEPPKAPVVESRDDF